MASFQNRQSKRYAFSVAVDIKMAHTGFRGRLKDISATGAGLDLCYAQFKTGDKITISTKDYGQFSGKVQWKSTQGFGVLFNDETQRSKHLATLISILQGI